MTDEDALVEELARAICAASGDTWREGPLRGPGMGNRDSDSLNNHWRHKARTLLPIVNARLDAITKERDAAAHKLSEWLNTQALLLACGELSAQEIRVVKAVLSSRIAAILTLDPAAIVRDQSNDLH